MKKIKLFYWAVCVLVLIYPAVSSSQITYVMNASAPYSYIPVTNPPITPWTGNADEGYVDLSLGDFAFQFYGVPVTPETKLRITTNGYMTFRTDEELDFWNYPIPYILGGVAQPPNALIAPLWDDLDLSVSGEVRWGVFGTAPSRYLVVEWFDVAPYGADLGVRYSFEAILYESTNEIKFQYSDVPDGGEFATVGVENFDGTSGSQFSCNTLSLNNGLAIEFTPKLVTLFFDDFSTNKGWTGYEPGGWERGPAVAGVAVNGYPDPGVDHSPSSENNILGFAIGADYPNSLPVEKSITSPPIDCSVQDRVFLKFWRYLNVESNSYDHAKVHVSNDDGLNWTQLWENPVFDITDNRWTQVVFDISSIAAKHGKVKIAFTMGPTNATGRYSGWNIDDLEVTSDYAGPLALYIIPSGNSPNPNIDEIMIKNGLGIKHDTAIPNDLSGYNILICSDGACDSTTANYIDLFLQDGGSAIIMGGTPYLLAGNTGDLSLISDWFGAGSYGNDGGSGTVTVPNPFDLSGDKVDYSASNSAPAVYNLNPGESVEISAWSGGGTHSFIHSYGQGRVFYYAGNPGYSGDSDPITVGNGLVLFEAGLFWTVADCPMPSITIPPESQTILSGETTTLSVAAMDTTLLSYQWYQGPSGDTSTPVGTNSSNYITPALTQTTSYWVRVSNSCGTYADSDTAIITMAGSCTAPSITSDPQNQTIQSGQTATLSVSASGTTLTYQWYQGLSGDSSNPISGATSSSFTTPALTQTTNYWVKVSNSCGYADSNAAAITVISAPVGSAPLANDDSVIWKRRTRFIAVLANDYDPDGMLNPSSVAIVTPPANGIATPITTGRRRRIGRVVYWPNAGFHGVDSFTYTVADNNGNISNVAKVTVTVP